MAWTRHGHQIIGTVAERRQDDMPMTKCGGPDICEDCKYDSDAANSLEFFHCSAFLTLDLNLVGGKTQTEEVLSKFLADKLEGTSVIGQGWKSGAYQIKVLTGDISF